MRNITEPPGPLPTTVPRSSIHPSEQDARAWWAVRQHAVRTSLILAAVPTAVSITVALLVQVTLPDADPMTGRLAAVLLLAAAVCLIVARARAWPVIGATGKASWSRPGLLTVPALVAVSPLVTGLDLPTPGILVVLAVGYAATGVFEEIWYRGVILDTLGSSGVGRSAVIGGALFAAGHLANIAFGQPVAVTLAQSVGAFCFGIGYAILRWRTNAVWLLAGIHAVGDLLFHITNLHGAALWGFLVGHDTIVLLWGLWCLRRGDTHVTRDLSTGCRTTSDPDRSHGSTPQSEKRRSYTVIDRVPTPAEHRTLANAVGWQDGFRWEAMPASMAASCCGVVVADLDGSVVAMGRVVGDGAFFFYLQDIAVHPDHQGQGLGRRVTRRLLENVHDLAGGDAFVGLFATEKATRLYRGEGFDDVSDMTGMWRILR